MSDQACRCGVGQRTDVIPVCLVLYKSLMRCKNRKLTVYGNSRTYFKNPSGHFVSSLDAKACI